MKILLMTDNPNINTGMARVGREVALQLVKHGHDVSYLGWFSNGMSKDKWPFDFIPTVEDPSGKDIFEDVILTKRPDVLLTIGDPWMYKFVGERKFKGVRNLFQWVGYTAVDGEKIDGGLPIFWDKIVLKMDKVITYTNYGKKAVLKSYPHLENDIETIYHGVNEGQFKPMDEASKNDLKAKHGLSNKFIFLVVARNQGRKNWTELLKAWKIIQEQNLCPDALLWPHTHFFDKSGHDFEGLLETFDLNQTKSIVFFEHIARGNSSVNLIPEEELSNLYNISDCLISAGGEGFGLPVLEAMASKLPTLVLNESATGELGAEGRANLMDADFYMTGKYLTERPIPTPTTISKAMEEVYNNKEKQEVIKEKAYKFAKDHTWDKVGKQWAKYFDKLEKPTKYPMILEEVTI